MCALAGRNFIRIAAVAICLSTLSFAAGVAGDLSIIDPPRSGQRVVLRLPPEIPADAVRAAPLPPLLSTASAEARPAPPARIEEPAVEPEIVNFSEIMAIELAHEPELALEPLLVDIVAPAPKPYRGVAMATEKPRRETPAQGYGVKPA